MKKISTAFALAMILALTCLPTSAAGPVDEAAVLDAVRANVDALEREDLPAYMATIHQDAPAYEGTKKIVAELFHDYDLEYQLEKIELVKEDDADQESGVAKVRFIQVTTLVKGGKFKNNRTTGVHTLKSSGGQWKLFSTEVENVEYLP